VFKSSLDGNRTNDVDLDVVFSLPPFPLMPYHCFYLSVPFFEWARLTVCFLAELCSDSIVSSIALISSSKPFSSIPLETSSTRVNTSKAPSVQSLVPIGLCLWRGIIGNHAKIIRISSRIATSIIGCGGPQSWFCDSGSMDTHVIHINSYATVLLVSCSLAVARQLIT